MRPKTTTNNKRIKRVESPGGSVYRPGEPMTSSADIRKIRRELKWTPLINFDDGINEMLKVLYKWKDAPLWTPKKIKKVTKTWFNYLSKK